jgi:hypothetical protein
VEQLKRSLNSIMDNPHLGGWESELGKHLTDKDVLRDVQLTHRERRRREHHTIMSDIRDYAAVRREIIMSLINFIDDRFDSDNTTVNILAPLSQLSMDIGEW